MEGPLACIAFSPQDQGQHIWYGDFQISPKRKYLVSGIVGTPFAAYVDHVLGLRGQDGMRGKECLFHNFACVINMFYFIHNTISYGVVTLVTSSQAGRRARLSQHLAVRVVGDAWFREYKGRGG